MENELQLSAATLAALKEFASSRGIVQDADENDDEEEHDSSRNVIEAVRSHFEIKDREEFFHFKFGDNIEFTLHGVKRELGQTLSSTGLTLWRAAEHLSQFCYDNQHLFRDKSILELGAGEISLFSTMSACNINSFLLYT
jgi:hypothetical protein